TSSSRRRYKLVSQPSRHPLRRDADTTCPRLGHRRGAGVSHGADPTQMAATDVASPSRAWQSQHPTDARRARCQSADVASQIERYDAGPALVALHGGARPWCGLEQVGPGPGCAEQEPLECVAAEGAKKALLGVGFDPFGDDSEVEGVRQVDDGRHDGGVVGSDTETGDELPVDFDGVDWQSFEVGE